VIARLVLLGAGGDLAGRFLLPALAGIGDEPIAVTGADTADWDDRTFRRHVAARLERHAPHVPHDRLLRSLRYRRADVADAGAVARALAGTGPVAVYLALPPRAFPAAVASVARAGLPLSSRVAIEKPFGEDLEGAVALNAGLANLVSEDAVFRVDHVLGMPATQRLIERRLGPDDGWDAEHIAEVEILWEETIALEGRAGFYDAAGALRDVLQNHMLQLLALVAMEPPAGVEDLRERKVAALRATHATDATRRGRYAGYAEEQGVDPARATETFAEVLMTVDTPRWAGTTFRLRAGKALSRGYKGIVLHRRDGEDERIEVDRLGEGEPPAYAHVLRDLLSGGSALSVRGDEAEEAWRIVTPVLRTWADDRVALLEYPAGSDGPPRLQSRY
jgi:glucose-6-phosphate 1-dehydrogenase